MKVHLSFYEKVMNSAHGSNCFTGKPLMPACGLCNCGFFGFINNSILHLFQPTQEELIELKDAGFDHIYWASGKRKGHKDNTYSFTSLRQTIVLFMAAINDEL